ncbi:NAD(P)-dependent oxidoreductase [Lactococcus termiticola]|uniref:NADH-flavin reductase n=1 Tax=Lactococcus termiticola TaxID=2169526 RepID=A0A2R5HIR1_9LACT|nr:NAD(P)-binding oxidoreductase [Lactococcus termiticola]GBG96240.1 NADH-flavin reductase [Lactococcus termiticola]
MKILLLGASGRTGQRIIRRAIAEGHEVVAYLRSPEKLAARPHLQLVAGELNDELKMLEAAEGCEAILVCLSASIHSLGQPLMTVAAQSVIKLARVHQIKRVIWLSALGVGETIKNASYPFKFAVESIFSSPFKDYELGEGQLRASGLDWTTLHPGVLKDDRDYGPARLIDASSGYKVPGLPQPVNREFIASEMLRMIDDETSFKKRFVFD